MSKKGLLRAPSVIVATVLVLGMYFTQTIAAAVPTPCMSLPNTAPDRSARAIVKGGTPTVGAIEKAYNTDITARDVYNYFGITNDDMHNLCRNTVAGMVYKNGDVYVGSKRVATNVSNTTRTYIPGSYPVTYNGFTFYVSPMSASLETNAAQAYVVMQQGTVRFSILADCGNITGG